MNIKIRTENFNRVELNIKYVSILFFFFCVKHCDANVIAGKAANGDERQAYTRTCNCSKQEKSYKVS